MTGRAPCGGGAVSEFRACGLWFFCARDDFEGELDFVLLSFELEQGVFEGDGVHVAAAQSAVTHPRQARWAVRCIALLAHADRQGFSRPL